jgi:hypothetical protein
MLFIGISSLGSVGVFAREIRHKIYGGFANMPVKVSGYKNAVLNDHHNYPNNSGETYVDFEKGNTNSSSTGVMIGYQFFFNKKHGLVADYTSIKSDNITVSVIGVGYSHTFVLTEKFSLAVIPKYGVALLKVDIGTVKRPVITDSGKFNEGDVIEAKASGSILSVSVKADYTIIKHLEAFAQIGLQASFFSKPKTTIDDTEVTDERAFDEVVYLEGDSSMHYDSETDIDPFSDAKIDMSGLVLVLGASYKF